MIKLGWLLEKVTNPEKAKRRKWVLEGISSFVQSLDEAKEDKVLSKLVKAEAIWELDKLLEKSDYNIQARLHQITEIAERKIRQKREEEKKLASLLSPKQNTLPVIMEKPVQKEDSKVEEKPAQKEEQKNEKKPIEKNELSDLKKFREYLKSTEWQKKRREKLDSVGLECERCCLASAKDNLNVYHKTFDKVYKETPNDLEVVCENCKKEENFLKASKK